MSRYKTEILSSKEISNKWGLMDNGKLANEIELLLNEYDQKGYSLNRLEWLHHSGMLGGCLLIFEKYDFTKE